mmetsp:Transcript_13418/g.58662  ORF Transcript_13418/g.58662 Transcript_13418/m.58662 type:complete len:314 (-) Transcript_13418:1708-2649(-)
MLMLLLHLHLQRRHGVVQAPSRRRVQPTPNARRRDTPRADHVPSSLPLDPPEHVGVRVLRHLELLRRVEQHQELGRGVDAQFLSIPPAAAAAAAAAAGIPGSVAPPSPKVEKKPAKRAPAPKTKAPANKKTSPAPAKKGVKREVSADPSDKASDDDLSDSEGGEGEGGKGKTTDEVRRQRRMLSNRESARRSRRRKLEHVATLEGQINQHKAENLALLERLRESEARVEGVVRENAQLKAEIVRMSEVAGAGGKPMERASSLQRIASAGNLAKSNLGGTASPQMSGDDSPRGFVPFRSLQSYENLLSLQAQGR